MELDILLAKTLDTENDQNTIANYYQTLFADVQPVHNGSRKREAFLGVSSGSYPVLYKIHD